MHSLLISCGHLARHYQRFEPELAARGIRVALPAVAGQQLDAAGMCAAIRGHQIVIAGDDVVDRSVLETGKAGGLRAVIKWGIGVDSIDLFAAKELGIPIYNTPGVFSDEVADVAAGYVVMLARGLHLMDTSVRNGGWRKVEGLSLRGRTAGIIGLGGIGRATAHRLAAFGMRVIGYDPLAIEPALLVSVGLQQLSLDDVLGASDFLVLTCALTPASRQLLSADAFSRMKPDVRIVNVSRGPVIDELALTEALTSGAVAGAALDVFEVEPLPVDSPLRGFEQVIFGTHNGSNTADAVDRVNRLTIDLALDLFGVSGQLPRLQPLAAA